MALIWPAQLMRDPDIFATDFGEYTLGTQPAGWSQQWVTTGFTALVQSASGSLSGKALRWTKTAANRNALSWDIIPSVADAEVLIRHRAIESWASAEIFIAPTIRGAGVAAAETGYRLPAGGGSSNTLYLSNFSKFVSGAGTTLGTFSYGPSPNYAVNNWNWLRFRMSGIQLSRRMWHHGAAEPGTWDEQITDASITGAGWTGLSAIGNNPDIEVDFFSVALRGKTAPSVRR